jgi:hypothetical protein
MKYIALLLLLFGCSWNSYIKLDITQEDIVQHSIVITGKNKVVFNKKLTSYLFLKSIKLKYYSYINLNYLTKIESIQETSKYEIFKINTGLNYLSFFYFNIDYICNTFKSPYRYCGISLMGGCDTCYDEYKENLLSDKGGLTYDTKQPAYASFTTNPNEIVYIGDLAFTENGLEYLDSYEEAVAWFYKEYPQFKDKPVIKRIATLGPYAKNISLKK